MGHSFQCVWDLVIFWRVAATVAGRRAWRFKCPKGWIASSQQSSFENEGFWSGSNLFNCAYLWFFPFFILVSQSNPCLLLTRKCLPSGHKLNNSPNDSSSGLYHITGVAGSMDFLNVLVTFGLSVYNVTRKRKLILNTALCSFQEVWPFEHRGWNGRAFLGEKRNKAVSYLL